MEIIHVVLGKVNPNRLNGINKVVYNLATEQVKSGRSVQVWGITPQPVHDYPERNFKTVLFKSSRFPFFIEKKMLSAILEHNNAVFHLHGGWVPVFSSISRFMRKNAIRYVITPHGAYNHIAVKKSRLVKSFYYTFFERQLLKAAHCIHLIGQSEIEGLDRLIKGTPFLLIPYGFNPVTKTELNLSDKQFIVGYIGRLDIYTKGLDVLIDAFDAFRQIVPHTALWIVGDGEGKSFLEQEVRSRGLTNVKLWGQQFGDDKEGLLCQMHVFAHPSRNEGLPTAVLEAAALGIASAVTIPTNMAFYVEKYRAGEIVQSVKSDDLYSALLRVYDHFQKGDYANYSNGARLMLENEFSWSKLVEKFDALYT
jgi:glycosyltransferase involved in cell wall biosynthesis